MPATPALTLPTYSRPSSGFDPSGRIIVNGTDTCSLLVSGVDAWADQLDGGLDGLYVLGGW